MLSVDILPALADLQETASVTTPTTDAAPQASAEAVMAFQTAMSSLVAGNRAMQEVLEKALVHPLEVPVPTKTAPAPEAVAAPKTKVSVTPEVVRQFAETIAPLVAENREVQMALETAVVRPLEVAAPVRTAVLPRQAAPTDEADRAQPAQDAGIVLQAAPVAQVAPAERVAVPDAAVSAVSGVTVPTPSSKAAPTPSEVLLAAAEAVADTLLVTPGLLAGEGQIRVQLRPDVLDGTEIQLNVSGKTIGVEFLPQTPDMGALIQRCLPQLEQHLAAKIHSFAIAATVSTGTDRRRRT